MQIGFDVGATKIESVVLNDNGEETNRSRIDCPKDYNLIVKAIKEVVFNLEKEFNKTLPVGVCHPGVHSPQTGLVKMHPTVSGLKKNLFKMI